MEWNRLADGRTCLPAGTILYLYDSGYYRITGDPIGYGGSGILYPARRLVKTEDGFAPEEMNLAVKECYPVSPGHTPVREDSGRLCAPEDPVYEYARGQMRAEKTVSGTIFNHGYRLVPLYSLAEREEISLDGSSFHAADNLYGTMERLDEKGCSIGTLLSGKRDSLSAWQITGILCQLLQALSEVHESGYIHGNIQENNVFVKGYDPQSPGTGLVTLIDFGSARPLLADGATAPIADRMLFTTSGYAAPEALSGNDGTLRLTPAADLYSAGILLLRLLTGRRYNAQALALVTDGTYVYPRQVRGRNCPASALTALNRVLAKALCVEPSERYQTAGEMLEELQRVEALLAPVKSEVAATDYAAFISYCHEEKASAAARLLQRRLERFRIPASLAEDGCRHLGKVFLDRQELSSGSDLGTAIRDALSHSEFLIVILSPGSADSPWVQEEVSFFLEGHSPDRVLTVLAEGEPHETLPPALQGETEGLAADLRAGTARGLSRKMKTELPRLAAPMLGCGYDDLVQRQRVYQLQRRVRFGAVTSVLALSVAAVIGVQSEKLRESYRQIFTERAASLAVQSRAQMASGDRTAAMETALEALPKDAEDREHPVVLSALSALSDSVNAYHGKISGLDFFRADHAMYMKRGNLQDTRVSPDQGRLLGRDSGGFRVFQILSGECLLDGDGGWLAEQEVTGELLFADFLEEESLLLVTREGMWRASLPDGRAEKIGAFPEQRYGSGVALICCGVSGDRTKLGIFRNSSRWWDAGGPETCLAVYDTGTGDVLWEDGADDGLQELLTLYTEGKQILFDEGGRHAVVVTSDSEGKEGTYGFAAVVDLESGKTGIYASDTVGYEKAAFTAEGDLILLGYRHGMGSNYEGVPGEIRCIDTKNGASLWESTHSFQVPDAKSAGIVIRKREMEEADEAGKSEEGSPEELLVWVNQTVWQIEPSSGEVRWAYTAKERVVGIFPYTESGNLMLLADGSCLTLQRDQQCMPLHTNIRTDVDGAVYADFYGFCVLTDAAKGRMILLRGGLHDPSEQSLLPEEALEEGCRLAGCHIDDVSDWMMMDVVDEDRNAYLVLENIATQEKREPIPVKGEGIRGWIGTDLVCFLVRIEKEDPQMRLFVYNAAEGEMVCDERIPYGEILFTNDYAYGLWICLQDEAGLRIVRIGETGEVGTREIAKGSLPEGLASGEAEIVDGAVLHGGESMLLTLKSGEEIPHSAVLLSLDTGEELSLPEEIAAMRSMGEVSFLAGNASDIFVVQDRDEEALYVARAGEETLLCRIPCREENNRSFLAQADFGRDDAALFLLDGDGILRMHDAQTGALLTESGERYVFASSLSCSRDGKRISLKGLDEEEEDFLMNTDFYGMTLRMPIYGQYTYFYQLDQDGSLCRMGEVLDGGYNEGSGLVWSQDHDPERLRLYPWHTPEDLREICG